MAIELEQPRIDLFKPAEIAAFTHRQIKSLSRSYFT